MKTRTVVFCGLLTGLCCWVGDSGAQDFEIAGTIKHTNKTINLDGLGNDPAWADANEYSDFFTSADAEPDDAQDLSATWKGLWDENNLYLLIEVNDADTVVDDDLDWRDDSIELYIDAQHLGFEEEPPLESYATGFGPSDYPVYQLTSLAGQAEVFNGINYLRWPDLDPDLIQPDLDRETIPYNGAATLEEHVKYSLEVALPWETMEETPENILSRGAFGFGIGINDDDDGAERDSQIMWATELGGLWNNATQFPVVDLGPPGGQLQAGDADQDFDFDQFDLIKVQIAAKYMTGQPATWGEGDWNGAPGGSPGNPPAGDGQFNQLDIIAALGPGHYMTGPYAAIAPGGQDGDEQTSIVYDPKTGELGVNAPASTELTSINIDSAAGIFTGDPAQNLGGSFDNDADNNIFKATFGGSFGTLSFGTVAQAGLSEEFVLGDLTVVGSLAGGGDLGNVDLIYVPEPSTLVLLALAPLLGVGRRRRTQHR